MNPNFNWFAACIEKRHVFYGALLGVLAALGFGALLQGVGFNALTTGLGAGVFGTLAVQFASRAIETHLGMLAVSWLEDDANTFTAEQESRP